MYPEDMITAQKNALKPGQTFRFHCDQCGDCCRNREDILLNPYDLFRVAGQLGTSPQEIVRRYCEVYIGQSSHFPVVRLLPVGRDKACPFLKENRCSIHKGKPTVCALFPLGRALQYDAEPGADGKRGHKLFYFLQKIACGRRDETHTVKEWLGEFGLEESEAWFLEWSSALEDLTVTLQAIEKEVSAELMQRLYNMVFTMVYLNYHGGVDFMAQFRGNVGKASQLLHGMVSEIEKFRSGGSE